MGTQKEMPDPAANYAVSFELRPVCNRGTGIPEAQPNLPASIARETALPQRTN